MGLHTVLLTSKLIKPDVLRQGNSSLSSEPISLTLDPGVPRPKVREEGAIG